MIGRGKEDLQLCLHIQAVGSHKFGSIVKLRGRISIRTSLILVPLSLEQ